MPSLQPLSPFPFPFSALPLPSPRPLTTQLTKTVLERTVLIATGTGLHQGARRRHGNPDNCQWEVFQQLQMKNATQRPNLKDTCPATPQAPLNKAFNVNLNGLKYFFLTYGSGT